MRKKNERGEKNDVIWIKGKIDKISEKFLINLIELIE